MRCGSTTPWLISFAALATGCAATVVEPAPDGGTTTTQALVVVERTETDGHAPLTNVSAKFLRAPVHVDSDVVERAVGAPLELPPAGQCVTLPWLDEGNDIEPSVAPGPIELLDVGEVGMRVGAASIVLSPRAFPDVGAVASGVFYTSPEAASDLPARATYLLEASGSRATDGTPGAVDPFSVTSEAPGTLDDIRVGDRALGPVVQLARGEALELRWRAAVSDASDAHDSIYVDLLAGSGAGLRCAFDDVGTGTIAASRISDVLEATAALANGSLSLHRVRQGLFRTSGIDQGEIRYDVAVAVRLTVGTDRRARATP